MYQDLIDDKILLSHNYEPYYKVREYDELYNKFCIVHATGTGKSFISIQYIYDKLKINKDYKTLYVVPRNGIKGQIIDSITGLKIDPSIKNMILNSIDFITYDALMNKSTEELKKYDLCIVDEFQHLGADKWSKKIYEMEELGIKIFGLSATPVREEYTSNPVDVSKTFFDGNVASYYDVADAMADGVLPIPEYKVTLITLLGACEYLKSKVDEGNASDAEKVKFYSMYDRIKKEIRSKNLMPDDIIRDNIKVSGKYIYFCSNYESLKIAKESFINNLTEEQRNNLELYEVYSGYTDKVNNNNSINFKLNKTLEGRSAEGKLRVMFSIDMYTEGIHIKDLDGVILGRGTKSQRVFNQQIGRALALEQKDKKPLVIDLAGNAYEMRNLLRKLKGKLKEKIELGESNLPYLDNIDLDYILSEEVLDVLVLFDELKEYTKDILNIDMLQKYQEFIEYVEDHREIPAQSGKRVASTEHIPNLGTFWNSYKQELYELINTEKYKTKYPQAYEIIINRYNSYLENKDLDMPQKYQEFIEYVEDHREIPAQSGKRVASTEHIPNLGQFWNNNKEKLYELINTEKYKTKYPQAYEIIINGYNSYLENKEIDMPQKYQEFIEYVEDHGEKPPNKRGRVASFKHINNLGQFWTSYKQELYEIINTEEYKTKYPQAYEIIIKAYNSYLENKEIDMPQKYQEFIEYVDNYREIPPSGGERVVSFKHINNLGEFWQTNKEKLYELINTEEYKNKYFNAYKTIIKAYNSYLENKENDVEMLQKYQEFIEYVETHGEIPGERVASTEHIPNLGTFWQRNKEKLYELINTEEYKNKSPNAYEVINFNYNLMNNKYQEFIKYVEINGKIPPASGEGVVSIEHIPNLGNFWNAHKETIYELINKEEYRIKYPNAYEIISNKYRKYIIKYMAKTDKWDDKKTTTNIKYVCSINDIDYELNKDILTHISYKELVAKINFLNKYNIPTCNNGMLSEIFTMSSPNMQLKYNIDLENLINNYFTVQSKVI